MMLSKAQHVNDFSQMGMRPMRPCQWGYLGMRMIIADNENHDKSMFLLSFGMHFAVDIVIFTFFKTFGVLLFIREKTENTICVGPHSALREAT
jgi:hypothetical protein